jgi:hypothetical protein
MLQQGFQLVQGHKMQQAYNRHEKVDLMVAGILYRLDT